MKTSGEIKIPLGTSWLLSGPVLAAIVIGLCNLVGFTDFPWWWIVAVALASWILLAASIVMVVGLLVISYAIKLTSLPIIRIDTGDDK